MPAYWRGGTCGCRQRGRGRGATTTVSPTRPHDPNHQHRHHASKSSHDDPSDNPNRSTRPLNPPDCEPILAQRPLNPCCKPELMSGSATMRANPHTMTPDQAKSPNLNRPTRQIASKSSHNGSRHRQTARLKPPAPPQCEPILTQRPAQPMAGESAGSRMCRHAPSDRPRHRLRYQTQSGTSRMPRHTRRAESHTD